MAEEAAEIIDQPGEVDVGNVAFSEQSPLVALEDIRPVDDRILVRRDKPSDTFGNQIIKADEYKEKPLLGTVLAVGPGKPTEAGGRQPMFINEGDRVLFGAFGGLDLPLELGLGRDLVFLREEEVLAVVGKA